MASLKTRPLQNYDGIEQKLATLIRKTELNKNQFQRGIFSFLFIPAKYIYMRNCKQRNSYLIKHLILNSFAGAENKIQIDREDIQSLAILSQLIDGEETGIKDYILFIVPFFSVSSIVGIVGQIAYKFPTFLGALGAMSVFGIIIALYNYTEYSRIRGELKKDYLALQKEIDELIK